MSILLPVPFYWLTRLITKACTKQQLGLLLFNNLAIASKHTVGNCIVIVAVVVNFVYAVFSLLSVRAELVSLIKSRFVLSQTVTLNHTLILLEARKGT